MGLAYVCVSVCVCAEIGSGRELISKLLKRGKCLHRNRDVRIGVCNTLFSITYKC